MENEKYLNIEHQKVYQMADWMRNVYGVWRKEKSYDSQNHNNLFIKMFALPTPDSQSVS